MVALITHTSVYVRTLTKSQGVYVEVDKGKLAKVHTPPSGNLECIYI